MELATRTSLLIWIYTRWFGAYSMLTTTHFEWVVYLIWSANPVEVTYTVSEYDTWNYSSGRFVVDDWPWVEMKRERVWDTFRIEDVESDSLALSLDQWVAIGTLELLTNKWYSTTTRTDTAFLTWTILDGEYMPCSIYLDTRSCSDWVRRRTWSFTKKARVSGPYRGSVQSVLWSAPYSPFGALSTFLVSANQSEVSFTE